MTIIIVEVTFFRIDPDPPNSLSERLARSMYMPLADDTQSIVLEVVRNLSDEGRYTSIRLRLEDDTGKLCKAMNSLYKNRQSIENTLKRILDCNKKRKKRKLHRIYEASLIQDKQKSEKLYRAVMHALQTTPVLAITALRDYRILEQNESRLFLLKHCATADKFNIIAFTADNLLEKPDKEDMILA